MNLDAKIPEGSLEKKWENYKKTPNWSILQIAKN